jgi:Fe-S cluster assembly protein SufD
VSRLHERQSCDPADVPVPTGRKEEWRFTPRRRLRGLQGDTALPQCKVTVETGPPPEVAASRAERRLGSAYLPADRVSARVCASFTEATVITVPAEAVASRPDAPRMAATPDGTLATGDATGRLRAGTLARQERGMPHRTLGLRSS